MKRHLLNVCLLLGMMVSCLMVSIKANAANVTYETIKVTNLDSLLEYDRDVALSWSHRWGFKKDVVEEGVVYGKFTLAKNSYVRIKIFLDSETKQSYESENNFLLFANESMAIPILGIGVDYGEEDEWIELSAGTYYVVLTGKLDKKSEARYTTKICIGATPVKGAVSVKMEPINKYKKVRVTVNQKLSKDAEIYYKKGRQSGLNKYNSTPLAPGVTSFVVDANDVYTVKVVVPSTEAFNDGLSVYLYPRVKLIDTKKPTVTGVKNEKVYRKTVTIKFKDKGSGIKSAKLNGKKIKTGKKVKKVGKYKLVVIDKAGNKTTVRFRIAKKK